MAVVDYLESVFTERKIPLHIVKPETLNESDLNLLEAMYQAIEIAEGKRTKAALPSIADAALAAAFVHFQRDTTKSKETALLQVELSGRGIGDPHSVGLNCTVAWNRADKLWQQDSVADAHYMLRMAVALGKWDSQIAGILDVVEARL